MRLPLSVLFCAGMLSMSAPSFAQEVAGRVLASVGDVTLVRGGQSLPAPRGTQVLAGDTVQLGAQSNAQVRFTDESVVALRSDTVFRVSEYSFQGRDQDSQRAFFNLLKGGMRTVTGLIGRIQHKNYAVTTPTATIGIRGTNYTLVQCDGNCRNRDGSAAPAGTYGAVTDGRIGVTNQSGEHQFGANQYFHVPGIAAAPQQLIAPPSFLRDTLEGRARREGGGQQQQQARAQQSAGAGTQQGGSSSSSAGSQSATTLAQTGLGGGNGDASVTSSVTSGTVPAVLTANVVPVTNEVPAVGPAALLLPTTTGTVYYRVSGAVNLPVTVCSGTCGTITFADITVGVNLTLQRASFAATFTVADTNQNIFNLSLPTNSGGIPITVSNGQITFSDTVYRADYPTQQGGFRCLNCGSGTGTTFLDWIGVNGTINGSTASVNFSGGNTGGGNGGFSVQLTQATPPNSLGAAMAIPHYDGSGASTPSSAYWYVSADASGKLLSFGPPVGANSASVGTAANTSVSLPPSTPPAPGNLVWGTWGAGANLTDFNYTSYTSTHTEPWITGTITNTLPASLGTVTYTPVGYIVNGSSTSGLNSAALTADFVNRNVSVSINATDSRNGTTFQMNGSAGINATSARFGAGFTTVSCSGGSCGGTPGGSFGGFFAGSNAEGAGISFAGGYGATNGVMGVIGMKR